MSHKLSSFKRIDKFVHELFDVHLLTDQEIKDIVELKNAQKTILDFRSGKINITSSDYLKYIVPLIEVLLPWEEIKKRENRRDYGSFITNCKRRVAAKKQSDFYGVMFEVDIAARCLLSGGDVSFVEKKTSDYRQIEFIFTKKGIKIGIECKSKRATHELTIDKLNRDILDRAEKFKEENLKQLGIDLDKKIIIFDITRKNYQPPQIANKIREIKVSDELDGIFLTWRELKSCDNGYSIETRYEPVGNVTKEDFPSMSYAFEIQQKNHGFVFFARKFTDSNPPSFKSYGTWKRIGKN